MSFPSWRYKELRPAGQAVIELKPSWHTVWARGRCSAEAGASPWEKPASYGRFPPSTRRRALSSPCINKRPNANPEEASAYIGSDCETEPRGSAAGQPRQELLESGPSLGIRRERRIFNSSRGISRHLTWRGHGALFGGELES